jgi:phage protein D
MPGDLFYRVKVSAAGADYDLSADLTSLSIEEDEARPALLTVNLADPYKVFGHALQEGMDVEVELGWVDDHSLVFRGRIYLVDADFPSAGVPRLTLRAHDNSMRLGLRRRTRPWTDTTLSGIVGSIADEHGFDSSGVHLVGDPTYAGNGIRQQNETDLAFVHRLADMYGAETYVAARDGLDEFVFVAQREVMTSDPEVTLYHGRCGIPNHLLSFQASADVAEIQLPRVFAGVDFDLGDALDAVKAFVDEVGTQDDPFFDENMTAFRAREPERAARLEELLGAAPAARSEVIEDLGEVDLVEAPTFVTAEDLRTLRQNQFSTSIHGMRGSGATDGNKDLRAQTNVALADVGGRFSGTWFLTQVRHMLDSAGYRTDFECRR